MARSDRHQTWRQEWIEEGMIWRSPTQRPPANWDTEKQFRWLLAVEEGVESNEIHSDDEYWYCKVEPTRAELTCPACGFWPLRNIPWSARGFFYEICFYGTCSCCGIRFGQDDSAGIDSDGRKAIYRRWRQEWIDDGMVWWLPGRLPPVDWNPEEQLKWLSTLVDGGTTQAVTDPHEGVGARIAPDLAGE